MGVCFPPPSPFAPFSPPHTEVVSVTLQIKQLKADIGYAVAILLRVRKFAVTPLDVARCVVSVSFYIAQGVFLITYPYKQPLLKEIQQKD